MFKLQTTISLSNFVLFNSNGRIAKYASEIDILKEFFGLRKELYHNRKEFLLARLQKDYEMLFNKVKFIQAVIADTIKVRKVKRANIMKQCKEFGLKTMTELNLIMHKYAKKIISPKPDTSDEKSGEESDNSSDEIPAKEYDYLLSMAIWSLTLERIADLERQMLAKKEEHDEL
jgi:DNA topoisomerase II